ncbi:MAG TPA: glycosyltransferase family 4 protein, partial [Bacteroidota bacterium]|nr:glycosyltransferase family 4 protein [Bacteroidota bacterium]
SLAAGARSLLSPFPYSVSRYYHKAFVRALDEELEREKFDVVHVDHLAMAPYGVHARKTRGVPIVLRGHNLETRFLRRYLDLETNPFVRMYGTLELPKLRRYEASVCGKYDMCAMITRDEADELLRMAPAVRQTVIPAGVELPAKPSTTGEEEKHILFLALLDWKPNVRGFMWFYEKVFPLLLSQEPNVILSIAGKGDSSELKNLNHPNVRFEGFVESVAPILARNQVCIVPLFAGSGMRVKVLEFLAHGKAIVSTSVGCEGIQVRPGRDILVADRPDEFARAILRLLKNPALRVSLGKQGRNLVQKKYGWKSIAKQFEDVYREVNRSRAKT